MLSSQQARKHLKKLGWSYRRAAPELGVTTKHLCLVLRDVRISGPLLERIMALQPCPDVPLNSPYAKQTKANGKTQVRKELAKA
ncbi:MAG: hypothetical protein ABSD58_13785 [Verrucomicrobiia bacterium]